RALDLAVPVGTLDQPHHEAQAMGAADSRDLVDEVQRARLVRLHRETEAAPLREAAREACGESLEDVERELEPVAFLGIDRQVDVGARRWLDELPHARQQLGKDALALRILVAREEGAQLDRDAVGTLRTGRDSTARDRLDRVAVRRE